MIYSDKYVINVHLYGCELELDKIDLIKSQFSCRIRYLSEVLLSDVVRCSNGRCLWDDIFTIPMNEANFETFIELELLLNKSMSTSSVIGSTKFPLASISEGDIFDDFIELLNNENSYIGRIKIKMEIESPLSLYNEISKNDSIIPPEYIVLYIDKGERIIEKQLFGNQEVFITIKFHDNEYETREMLSNNVTNPEWKARFVLNIPLNAYNFIDDFIIFELSTCNIIGPTTLGSFKLPIKPYIDGLLYNEEIIIRNKEGKMNGKIYIRLQCMYKKTGKINQIYREGNKHIKCNNLCDFLGESLEYIINCKDIYLSHNNNNEEDKMDISELSKIISELEIDKPKIIEYRGNTKELSFKEFLLWFTQLSIINNTKIPLLKQQLPTEVKCINCQNMTTISPDSLSQHCNNCNSIIYNPIMILSQTYLDISLDQGSLITCHNLLDEWFKTIDTSNTGFMDSFDGIRLFTVLNFQHPNQCWKELIKHSKDENMINKKEWINYMYKILPKDETLYFPNDETMRTIRREINKCKRLLGRWKCNNCNNLNYYSGFICGKCDNSNIHIPHNVGISFEGKLNTNKPDVGVLWIKIVLRLDNKMYHGEYQCRTINENEFTTHSIGVIGYTNESNNNILLKIYDGEENVIFINGVFVGSNGFKICYNDLNDLRGDGTLHSNERGLPDKNYSLAGHKLTSYTSNRSINDDNMNTSRNRRMTVDGSGVKRDEFMGNKNTRSESCIFQ